MTKTNTKPATGAALALTIPLRETKMLRDENARLRNDINDIRETVRKADPARTSNEELRTILGDTVRAVRIQSDGTEKELRSLNKDVAEIRRDLQHIRTLVRDDALHELLARPLSGIGMDRRLAGFLERNGIRDVGTLCSCSTADLRGIGGIGRRSLGAVLSLLDRQGLAPGTDYSALGYRNPFAEMGAVEEPAAAATEEERLERLLPMETDRFGLSARLYSNLKALGIGTLGALCSCDRRELARTCRIGRKSLAEADALLRRFGLSFGSDYSALGYRNPLARTGIEAELATAATEEERLERLLSVEVGRLGLSVRLYNALKAHDIDTLGALCSCDRRELGRCRNLGRKALAEADRLLARFGLSFGSDYSALGYLSPLAAEPRKPQDGGTAATDREEE